MFGFTHSRKQSGGQRVARRRNRRLALERLEDRVVLTTVAPGFEVVEYFSYNASIVNGPTDIAFGEGGLFGQDLYFTDNSVNRLYRIADSNGDGDGLDSGEGQIMFQFPTGGASRPQNLVFGNGVGSFGNDLFLVDDGPNRVFRVSDDSGSFVISTMASGFFTPTGADFTGDGNSMLVADAANFTVFGGGADGKIYRVSQSGTRTLWATGNQLQSGLWDINSQAQTTSDGWFTVGNAGIFSPGGPRELVQFRDNNGDGDALDAGEARVLISRDAYAALSISVTTFAFDDNDVLYLWGGTTGLGISRLEDLNGDGDYFDAGSGQFDAGERTIIVDDFLTGTGASARALRIGPDGDLYVGVRIGSQGKVYRVGVPAEDSNQVPTADPGGAYAVAEGSSVALDGTASSDPDGTVDLYEWDFDYDGTFNVDATGATPTFSAAGLDGFTSRTIALRVTDNEGATSDVVTTSLDVTNVAPMASVTGPTDGLKDELLTFTLGASDPSAADAGFGYDYNIDWDGDGVVDQTVSGPDGHQVEHAYAAPGEYTVIVTATDQDLDEGAQAMHSLTIIQPLSLEIGPQQVNLNGKGVLPIALLSSAGFDATTVDVSTVQLSGAAVVRHSLEDVDGDGDLDLLLKFNRQDFLDAYFAALASDLEDGTLDDNHQQVELELTGQTTDGIDIFGAALVDLFMTGKKLDEILDQL